MYDATIAAVVSIIIADARCDHTGQPQLLDRVTYAPFEFRKCRCSLETPTVFLLPTDSRLYYFRRETLRASALILIS